MTALHAGVCIAPFRCASSARRVAFVDERRVVPGDGRGPTKGRRETLTQSRGQRGSADCHKGGTPTLRPRGL
jgi:hypothetical protein